MQAKTLVAKVQSSQVFKDWFEKNDSAVLAHIFFMVSEDAPDSFDVGYYIKKEDKIASFTVKDDDVIFNGDSEVFKHPDSEVQQLDLEDVDISSEQALKAVDKFQKKEYSSSTPFKRIVLLQHVPVGQVWNVTYVTQQFKTLNIKVDAKTGEIKEHKLLDLIQKAL